MTRGGKQTLTDEENVLWKWTGVISILLKKNIYTQEKWKKFIRISTEGVERQAKIKSQNGVQ